MLNSSDRIITEKQAQQLLDFLVKQPFFAVHPLVTVLMNARTISNVDEFRAEIESQLKREKTQWRAVKKSDAIPIGA